MDLLATCCLALSFVTDSKSKCPLTQNAFEGISMVEWKQKLAGGGREPKLKEIYEKCNGAANGSVTTTELKAALSDADIQSSLGITVAFVVYLF